MISKYEIININSKVKINRESYEEGKEDFSLLDKENANFIRKDLKSAEKKVLPVGNFKSFSADVNYSVINSEVGLRFLLYGKNEHFVSFDVFSISRFRAKNNKQKLKPMIRLGIAYGTKLHLKSLQDSFLEIALSQQSSHFNSTELFSSINFGGNLTHKFSFITTAEQNYVSQQSPERYLLAQLYKKGYF